MRPNALRNTMSQGLIRNLLVLAAALPAAVHAQVPSDSIFKDFQRNADYVLVVDGKDVPAAELYKQETLPAFLILTSALPSPVLISPRNSSVETVNVMKVAKQKDGTVDLLADATLAAQGGFDIDGGDITFTADGHKVR